MIPKFRFYSKRMNKIGIVISLKPLRNRVYVEWDDTLSGTENIDDNGILMQSTGLFDRNGVEIFEGDIVKVMDMTLAVVKYSKARGAYYLDCGNKIGDAGLICQYDTIEVLGNIFENPESMEEMQ